MLQLEIENQDIGTALWLLHRLPSDQHLYQYPSSLRISHCNPISFLLPIDRLFSINRTIAGVA